MMKNIKLIVCDIDGTITRLDHSTSQRNIDVIEKCRDKGYLFGLASGRPLDDVLSKYISWNMRSQFDFIIGWNGCELYDNHLNNSYQFNFLSCDEIKEIINFMSKYDCTVNMYRPGIYLSNKETDRAWYSAFKNKRKFVVCDKLSDYYLEPNGGIMFRVKLEDTPIIEQDIKENLKNKNYIGFKTQADLIEFSNVNSNKGYALKRYCEIKNISLNECVAFGDTSNDNQMLKICNGVCMKNGSDDTKACAKYITDLDCDDDGFAEFVEKHLL